MANIISIKEEITTNLFTLYLCKSWQEYQDWICENENIVFTQMANIYKINTKKHKTFCNQLIIFTGLKVLSLLITCDRYWPLFNPLEPKFSAWYDVQETGIEIDCCIRSEVMNDHHLYLMFSILSITLCERNTWC